MELERFGVNLNHLWGEKNVVADAFCRLAMNEESTFVEHSMDSYDITQDVGFDPKDVPLDIFPVRFAMIAREQASEDKSLLAKVQQPSPNYSIESFHGGGKQIDLICYGGKISAPKTLQSRVINWCHTALCHPGENRTEQMIRQYLHWKNLRAEVKQICI
jgi:hypothetical protein